jgi:hypothetical protein
MEKPAVCTGSFIPPTTEFFTLPHAIIVFRCLKGELFFSPMLKKSSGYCSETFFPHEWKNVIGLTPEKGRLFRHARSEKVFLKGPEDF